MVNNTSIWLYLPETYTLCQYLGQSELIELSMVCKKYRNILKPHALRSIRIPSNKLRLQYIRSRKSTGFYNDIKDSLSKALNEECNLIKEVTFNMLFPSDFIIDIVAMLPKITHIKIKNFKQWYNLKHLIRNLQNLDTLQHIEFKPYFYYIIPLDDNVYYNFFYRLKTINVRVAPELIKHRLPLDVIDTSFSNLNCLTIINDRMLLKLSNGLPSLISVNFSRDYEFDKSELSIFILNNSQLKNLTISTNNLDESILKSILSLENLTTLEIYHTPGNRLPFINCSTPNNSIKRFKFYKYGHKKSILRILKLCKNLKIFEINKSRFTGTLNSIRNDYRNSFNMQS